MLIWLEISCGEYVQGAYQDCVNEKITNTARIYNNINTNKLKRFTKTLYYVVSWLATEATVTGWSLNLTSETNDVDQLLTPRKDFARCSPIDVKCLLKISEICWEQEYDWPLLLLRTVSQKEKLPLRIWVDHIDFVRKKVNQRLGVLRRIKHFLPFYARKLFVNTMVLPSQFGLLRHCLRWYRNNTVLLESLQLLQNRAAKILLGRTVYSSSTH